MPISGCGGRCVYSTLCKSFNKPRLSTHCTPGPVLGTWETVRTSQAAASCCELMSRRQELLPLAPGVISGVLLEAA